jgi:predicted TIM-barrel fold metal-dependent hydrolase
MSTEGALISVDDHIIEPPHLWEKRLPAKYRDVGPRIEVHETGPSDPKIPLNQKRNVIQKPGGIEFWHYEDLLIPTAGVNAASGKPKEAFSVDPVNFAEMRPGCYDPIARLEDMDLDGVLASLSFPSFARFCGQTFLEGKDKELSLLCVQAYNDFVIDEWCGAAPGRYIPMCILPLWDPGLAVKEIERMAGRGCRAITFSENPAKLGLPSIHDANRYWDPVFAAAAEAELPLCMHIGSSSDPIVTAPDAPMHVLVGLVTMLAQISFFDWIMSGQLERHPTLRIAFSEGGIGWIPYMLEKADYTWERHGAWTGTSLPRPPSEYFRDQIYGCFIDDQHGADNLHRIGIENCMIETDYPHTDSSWPNSTATAAKQLAHLSEEDRYKVLRGNAERLFRFQPSGIGQR